MPLIKRCFRGGGSSLFRTDNSISPFETSIERDKRNAFWRKKYPIYESELVRMAGTEEQATRQNFKRCKP